MPEKPAAPNPQPPKDCNSDGVVNIYETRLAMHRWAYPFHHQCGHYRGFRSPEPTRCLSCIKSDRIKARRGLAGFALACIIGFTITCLGCCAAGGGHL